MCLALYYGKWLQITLPEADSILSSTLGVSGVLVGFLATSKAILLSMNSQIIQDLRESGYMNFLVSYIGQAIWLNLVFCVLNVIGFFHNHTQALYSCLWLTLAIGALCAFIRVADTMLAIFKHH